MGPLFRRWLPNPESLRRHRSLRWLGPLLDRAWLWRVDRHGIASGLAAGLFLGLLIPVGQTLFACLAALLLRANLPAAVFATFISNPLTTPAILLAGYHLGVVVLDLPTQLTDNALAGLSLMDKLSAMREPLLAGLAILASSAALVGYIGVTVAWRMPAWLRLMRQRRRKAGREPQSRA